MRRAILTLAALPDRERQWLRGPRALPPMVLSQSERQREFGLDVALIAAAEAQEFYSRKARRFRPTPADIDRAPKVLAWLAWLRQSVHDGDRDARILLARAHGTPFWRIGQRLGRSDRTVQRWEAGAIAAIANRFAAEIAALSASAPRKVERFHLAPKRGTPR